MPRWTQPYQDGGRSDQGVCCVRVGPRSPFCKVFSRAIKRVYAKENKAAAVVGHESIPLNDALSASDRSLDKCWAWRWKSRINVLEGHGGVSILPLAVVQIPDSRFNRWLDSRAAKGALAKGRSSSRALKPVCKRAAALQLAFGPYPGWGFAPTRLNLADDPTRRVEIRPPVSHSLPL